jgi:hypothetical protein
MLRGGALALLLSSAAPRALAWRSPDARRDANGSDAAERAPTWAPATLAGEVLVKSDRLGRLAVLVDDAQDGRTSRGAATRMFLLTPAAPLERPVEIRLPLASVVFRGDSLSVSTPSGRCLVDLALASRSDGRHAADEDRIVLHDGLALQSVRFAGAPVPLDRVTLDDRPVALLDAAGGAATTCQAGGEGSSTCTKKCSVGVASASFIDECSVTCNTGYHACCNCIVPRQGATCCCVKDAIVGPQQPGTVKLDRD